MNEKEDDGGKFHVEVLGNHCSRADSTGTNVSRPHHCHVLRSTNAAFYQCTDSTAETNTPSS